MIIKPSLGGNGRGIHVFMENSSSDIEQVKSIVKDEPYIAQNLVDGYDIDCSVLCRAGEICQFTIQKVVEHDKNNQFKPSPLIQFVHNQDLFAEVTKLMSALKWDGVAHIDLRFCYQSRRYYVIEINPRFWGSIMGSFAAGVNFATACLPDNKAEAMLPFREIQYRSGNNLRHGLRGLLDPEYASGLRHFLADPLPELARKFSR